MPTVVFKLFAGQGTERADRRTCQHCILWAILLVQIVFMSLH